MKLIIFQLFRHYFDWRTWDHLYREMKKQMKKQNKPSISTIPYINKPGITFSIDDSFRVNDWYRYGKELFGFYDVKVSFNINAYHHYEGKREHTQSEIDMLIDLQANGHEIAHHGFNHENAVNYSEQFGMKRWIKDEIENLFNWMDKQSHSKTGEKFKKPVTFVFPSFSYDKQTIEEVVPEYFKIARGHRKGSNITPLNHTGFAPSVCIDSHYLSNPKNIKRVIKLLKNYGGNLILSCHSILPEDVSWKEFGWEMDDHAMKWRVSPKTLNYIITEAKKHDLEFYTTAEVAGIATFIDRNFESYVKRLLNKQSNDWILISELISINELNISNQRISNLDGIQYFLGLEKLDVSNNNIMDFRLLEKLPRLKEVIIINQSNNKTQIV